MVHEGGYTIENVILKEDPIDVQFFQQLNIADTGQFDFEKNLRGDWVSFNSVRKLMPAVYRFRVVDGNGEEVVGDGVYGVSDSTRVECREAWGEYFSQSVNTMSLLSAA